VALRIKLGNYSKLLERAQKANWSNGNKPAQLGELLFPQPLWRIPRPLVHAMDQQLWKPKATKGQRMGQKCTFVNWKFWRINPLKGSDQFPELKAFNMVQRGVEMFGTQH